VLTTESTSFTKDVMGRWAGRRRSHAGAGYRRAGAASSARNAEADGQVPVVIATWATAHEKASALIRNWRPHVLHLHVFWLWPLAARLKADTGVPVVYTVHSLDRAEYEIGHGPPECLTQLDTQAATIRGADRVLALTRSEARLIEKYCPASRGKIRIAGNGITLCETPASPQSASSGLPMILFSGRFVVLRSHGQPGRGRPCGNCGRGAK
jgi:glycosyltransferase involved in cell wall biosynthesis